MRSARSKISSPRPARCATSTVRADPGSGSTATSTPDMSSRPTTTRWSRRSSAGAGTATKRSRGCGGRFKRRSSRGSTRRFHSISRYWRTRSSAAARSTPATWTSSSPAGSRRRERGPVAAGIEALTRVDLYLTPAEAERAPLDARQIVVIDVLRSCTSIAVALSNGAAKIIPVATVEGAARLASTLDAKSRLLCGERDGHKVSGFDLGNSPREYARERVEGATLIFASTNASPLMAGLLDGREQLLLAYVNVGAVAEAVRRKGEDVAIVCAGKNRRFALEDTACAGALIARIRSAVAGIAVNDA